MGLLGGDAEIRVDSCHSWLEAGNGFRLRPAHRLVNRRCSNWMASRCCIHTMMPSCRTWLESLRGRTGPILEARGERSRFGSNFRAAFRTAPRVRFGVEEQADDHP
jgi:hypothetical protein